MDRYKQMHLTIDELAAEGRQIRIDHQSTVNALGAANIEIKQLRQRIRNLEILEKYKSLYEGAQRALKEIPLKKK